MNNPMRKNEITIVGAGLVGALLDHLNDSGIIVDWREPDVIRASPTPLYNRRIDCLRLVRGIQAWAADRG